VKPDMAFMILPFTFLFLSYTYYHKREANRAAESTLSFAV
jgi:hypothetical protein